MSELKNIKKDLKRLNFLKKKKDAIDVEYKDLSKKLRGFKKTFASLGKIFKNEDPKPPAKKEIKT